MMAMIKSKPLSYAFACSVTLVGAAIAFQIFKGANFSLSNSTVGDLTIGQGSEQRTVNEFLNDTRNALEVAEATIDELSLKIIMLENKIKTTEEKLSVARANQIGSDMPARASVSAPLSEGQKPGRVSSKVTAAKKILDLQKAMTSSFIKHGATKPVAKSKR